MKTKIAADGDSREDGVADGYALDEIAQRLRECRHGMKLTQKDVAERIGVRRRAVYEWESGQRLPRSSLPALAALYGVSPTWLLTGVESTSAELRALRLEVEGLQSQLTSLAAQVAAATEVLVSLAERFASGD